MTIELEESKKNSKIINSDVIKKTKKVSRKKTVDIKHVARKLIMSWKQASEKQTITWREIAPIIDSIDYLSSHWKNDERLKNVEPIAIEIVKKINKVHAELNLRVFGMNRLRMITDEFLEVLKNSENNTPKTSTIHNKEDQNNSDPSSISVVNDTTNSENTLLSSDKLKKLIASLIQLSELLKVESEENNTNTHLQPVTSSHKQKSKKRNIFSGFFSSSSSSQKQSNSQNDSNTNISSSTMSNSSSSKGYTSTSSKHHSNSSDMSSNITSIPNSMNTNSVNSYQNDYRSNIVSEWQEYTRKFVEPSALFKVCKCYLNAMPSAIPEMAQVLGQNWVCIANEISVSLWNVLRKREDDLASSLIFLTLYKHGSSEIIERAINTIGSQLPEYLVVRLKIALNIKKESELTNEQLMMLQSDYEDILNAKKVSVSAPVTPSSDESKRFSNRKSQSFKKNDKKSSNKLNKEKKSSSSSDTEEPLSFAEMLAM